MLSLMTCQIRSRKKDPGRGLGTTNRLFALWLMCSLMAQVAAGPTNNNINLCKGEQYGGSAIWTASAGSDKANKLVNGRFQTTDCTSCATIAVDNGLAWFMIDLGSIMDISTIVFQGAWADTTDYGTTMVRKWGTSADANDPCNTEIV